MKILAEFTLSKTYGPTVDASLVAEALDDEVSSIAAVWVADPDSDKDSEYNVDDVTVRVAD